VTPKSLLSLAAVLVSRRLVTLDEVLPHCSPSLAECGLRDRARSEAQAAAALNVGRVNLNETAAEAAAQVEAEARGLPTLDGEAGGADQAGSNQVAGLLEALLALGAWQAAADLVLLLEAEGCYDVGSHPSTRTALCGFVKELTCPLYDAHCSLASKGLSITAAKFPPRAAAAKAI
jgi:hypothetical protein